MSQLLRHLRAVLCKRPGQALWLWGEPGVGKTFTAQALLREVPCRGLSLHATLPDRALLLSLPWPSRQPIWTEAQRHRILQGQHVPVADLVDTLTATLGALAPFVLHIDDLHEADSDRQNLVKKLAQGVLRLRGVGLLVTSRSEAPLPFQGYRVEPLSPAESDQLLRAQAGGELPREGLAWVFSRAQGNPLYTLEFWRYLSRWGYFWSDGRCWHWRSPPEAFVPVSVEALIAQALSPFTEVSETQAVLEARALLPNGLIDEGFYLLWSKVAGVEGRVLAQTQDLLSQQGILYQGRFAHPLMQEAVRCQIPEARKQRYARRALAELSERPEEAAPFVELACLAPEEALGLFLSAAQSAESRGDTRGKARWLAQAVKWASGPEQSQRALEAAQLLKGFDPAQALQMARIAVSTSPPDPEAILLLAELLAVQGDLPQAEAVLRLLSPSGEGTLRGWEAQIYILAKGGRWRQAVELWGQESDYQAGASLRTRLQVATCLAFLNKLEEVEGMLEALPGFSSLPPALQLAALNLRGQIQSYRGNHVQALETEKDFLALARSTSSVQALLSGLLNYASTSNALGLRGQAKACVLEAQTLSLQHGETMRYAVVQLRLADMLADEGEFEQAEARLLEAQDLLGYHYQAQWKAEGHLKLARLYLTWKPLHGPMLALKHAQSALALAQASGDTKFMASSLAYLSRAHSQMGNAVAALEAARSAWPYAWRRA